MNIQRQHLTMLAAAIAELTPLPAPADAMLYQFFRRHRAMGQQDRAFVTEGIFAWLRRRRSLEFLAGTTEPGKLALAVAIRERGYSLRDLEGAVGSNDAEWIRAFKARLGSELPPAVASDVPDWLWDRLGVAFDDTERQALTRAWQDPAPLDLRVNELKASRDDVRARLADEGVEVELTPWSPVGLRARGRPSLTRHPLLVDGTIEIQDEGSQLVGYLVAPRRSDMVADFCAGAGGKTLLLGTLMRSQGRLYAYDVVDKRLDNLRQRLKRSGLSNVHPQLIVTERDTRIKRLARKIDRVLVDAPCTGFGTLRRNPDLKWRQRPSAVDELATKQQAILVAAATLVKPGGRLVYATCSVLPEENEGVVGTFLAAHPDFALGNAATELARAGITLDTGPELRLLPHRHGCDGFYAAVLERQAASKTAEP